MTHSRGFVPFIVVLLLSGVLIPICSATQQQSQGQPLQGVLEYVFGDSANHTVAPARYFLSAGENRIELLFESPPWHSYLGKPVLVEGTAVSIQGEAVSAFRVSRISLAPSEQVKSAAVTGTRKVVLLLVKFLGDLQEPHAPSWYTDALFNPSSGNTVNNFYLASSWGQFGWTATATNWMTLPSPKTTYANCGWDEACLNYQLLYKDAVGLGVSNGIDFNPYDNIAIVTNNDLDCCAYGGEEAYNGKPYGVVWMPPWSAEQGVFAHELGHSIGLPHSGWVYYAYDSPWDVMSNGNRYNPVPCGSYSSENDGGLLSPIYCFTPADIIAPYKDMLGWIDPSHLLTVLAGDTVGEVLVDTLAAPLSTPRKMVKICVAGYDCTSGGATAQYYTVEVRTHYLADPGFDYYLRNQGMIIHFYWGDRPPQMPNSCFLNEQSGPAYPIDNFNIAPAPHYLGPPDCTELVSGQRRGLYYANWNDGQVYDNGAGIKVHVASHSVSASVTIYKIDINRGPPRAGVSQPYVLGFKVSDVHSGSVTGDYSYLSTGWSASDASFQVTLGAGESIFLIGTAQVWNDYASVGSSIGITRNGVLVSGDMFAAGATITGRELASAIAVDTPGSGLWTYALSAKTDPGGRAWISQPYILGFKVSDVDSSSVSGDYSYSSAGWSSSPASFTVDLGAGESLFLIGTAQVWNDYGLIGSSIGITRDGVTLVSGDMFAAGATITSRELASAVAVDTPGAGSFTYSLSAKTDPGGKAWISQLYLLAFKVPNVYSSAVAGDYFYSSKSWSPTQAGFDAAFGSGESMFIIGTSQLWNDYSNVGSSIAITQGDVRVSGDMFAAGATISHRELAVAIAVSTPGSGTWTYALSAKTD